MHDAKSFLVAGPMGAGYCGYLVTGSDMAAQALGPDSSSVIAKLDAQDVPILPIHPGAPDAVPAPVIPARLDGISGLSQTAPADRLDGWVRLVAVGFLSVHTDWDGVLVILSAGRSHWLHISANEVVSFQTTLTPQLVSMLGGRADFTADDLSETLSRPERLAAALSRADYAGDGRKVTAALIGAELAAMRPYWLGQNLAIISPSDAPDYSSALRVQGGLVTDMPLKEALRAAMTALWQRLNP